MSKHYTRTKLSFNLIQHFDPPWGNNPTTNTSTTTFTQLHSPHLLITSSGPHKPFPPQSATSKYTILPWHPPPPPRQSQPSSASVSWPQPLQPTSYTLTPSLPSSDSPNIDVTLRLFWVQTRKAHPQDL